MATRCAQELCPNWAGDGDVCPCAIFDLPRPGEPGSAACLLADCRFTFAGSCDAHPFGCPDCRCGSPLHWEPV